ncbi:dimethylaniline monooxygenase [N-oxide-forming] 1 isoform X2 [Cephus cinctus]|nr:dimethylaniline monooxygenase [N-oxide-forming] 1 isoform X2 [Cephus cinctus]
MQIPDFPFADQDGPSFVHHSVIRKYLLDYAKHFNLYPHIKLNTVVKRVTPETLSAGQVTWMVTSLDLETKVETTKAFDAVILCNGRYTVGNVPRINGIESFPGNCIHSHQYRTPNQYAGKKVCILGASWSGIDIAMEVSNYAEKIYLSHNLSHPLTAKMSNCVQQKPGIKEIKGNTFIFQDNSTAEVDEFIYCTGYRFSFPFMSDKVQIRIFDYHIEPIYKHLIHMNMPNLFVMGLPNMVIPFPLFHLQAQYIVAILDGRVKLPTQQEMREECEMEKKALLDMGIPKKEITKMNERQWLYYEELANAAGTSTLPPVVRKIYEHSNIMREQDFTTYKNLQYRIVDKENFTYSYCKLC